jgi:hypothetical protein
LDCISEWRQKLAEGEIDRGSVVTLEADTHRRNRLVSRIA